MRLQTQVQGKPYKSQEAEEQRFTEDLHKSTQAIQNETLAVRGKREVIYNFKDFCDAANYGVSYGPPSTSSNGCEIGRYYCRGYAEPVCTETFSFGCYTFGHYGIPKCTATVETVEIENRKVKMTTACGCAQ